MEEQRTKFFNTDEAIGWGIRTMNSSGYPKEKRKSIIKCWLWTCVAGIAIGNAVYHAERFGTYKTMINVTSDRFLDATLKDAADKGITMAD